ncbi:hypothetical protein MRB53_033198 [Persea americana]|uniref:Uncharacterized protein n=1 Tax=Persea americana TaxID=3435 RepID=A0ACC2KUL5_PERAE|nr:hypothetical protein MRB53_033198 [Persea americana]
MSNIPFLYVCMMRAGAAAEEEEEEVDLPVAVGCWRSLTMSLWALRAALHSKWPTGAVRETAEERQGVTEVNVGVGKHMLDREPKRVGCGRMGKGEMHTPTP